jgi:hypothetical protein
MILDSLGSIYLRDPELSVKIFDALPEPVQFFFYGIFGLIILVNIAIVIFELFIDKQ